MFLSSSPGRCWPRASVRSARRCGSWGWRPFARYHEVLSRARWDARAVARKLLVQVLDVFLPTGAVVIGIDDTIERRGGARIKARGIYRDPVRSSHGHFVKACGGCR
jgi:DDE superfamily endonuclease